MNSKFVLFSYNYASVIGSLGLFLAFYNLLYAIC